MQSQFLKRVLPFAISKSCFAIKFDMIPSPVKKNKGKHKLKNMKTIMDLPSVLI